MKYIPLIISNSCVGAEIYKRFKCEYYTPFIGTLIPNDIEYIKLCNNIEYYINIEPICNSEPKNDTPFAIQNGSKYYRHKSIKIPYPVIHLDDIEIHCIHEKKCLEALNKFTRRLNRMKNIMKNNNYKIIKTLSYSELFNNHENIKDVIDTFIQDKYNYFLGPAKYNINCSNYISIKEWDNISLDRDNSHVLIFNNQPFSGKKLYNRVKDLTISDFQSSN